MTMIIGKSTEVFTLSTVEMVVFAIARLWRVAAKTHILLKGNAICVQ
jgi:hypothetical protein